MVWTPHLTVAAIAERDGKFLLVEERAGDAQVINQPAGHLDAGETLAQGCAREVREETAWEFRPEALIGIYQFQPPDSPHMYLRFAFCGQLLREHAGRTLDAPIIRTLWMTRSEVAALEPARRRSPMVLQGIDDYLAGVRHPLSLLHATPP